MPFGILGPTTKLSFRLARAGLISILLAVASSAKPSLSAGNPAQDKETPGTSSLTQKQAAIQREPQNAKLYIKLGQAYWNSADYQSAFETFKQALNLAPISADAHNWMGAFLMGRGNLPDSISELGKAVSLDPKYASKSRNAQHAGGDRE